MIDMRLIEMGHARALLSLDDDLQVQAARQVVRKRLSVRETEGLVRRLQQSKKQKGHRRVDPDILNLQNRLGEALGARVHIQHQASGKGKLVISYNNSDEFQGILERLNLDD
jgi:ParB family chromosome partitioning protein